MKKIPSLFIRNFDTGKVTREVNPVAQWVAQGEGVATRKWDGACCMIKGGRFYKRYTVRPNKKEPDNFIFCEKDPNTGKKFGWIPVTDGPEDIYFREGFNNFIEQQVIREGTYELVGPKVNNNNDGFSYHTLIQHGITLLLDAPRTFDELKKYLSDGRIEGIVWWHKDGRKAKIKGVDFGIERQIYWYGGTV